MDLNLSKQPYRILLIEPDMKVAQIIMDWLQDKAQITHVTEETQAKEKAVLKIWDLVITDMNHPELNDLDITLLVKTANPQTSLLIVTENKKVDFIITAMQHHADGLMFKPLDQLELTNKVISLASESRAQRLKAKKIILAIGAHPDDVEIGCGGTLSKHLSEGGQLHIVTLSQGEVGGSANIRVEESRHAALLLEAELVLGNFTDTEITHSLKTIQFIERVVHDVKPTHVYTHSFHDNHQDHRNTYHATITACRQISNLYCYLSPSSTIDYRPNAFINIDQFIDNKIKAVDAFASQRSIRPYLEEDFIRASARYWGRFCNYHLAEPMEVIKEHS